MAIQFAHYLLKAYHLLDLCLFKFVMCLHKICTGSIDAAQLAMVHGVDCAGGREL